MKTRLVADSRVGLGADVSALSFRAGVLGLLLCSVACWPFLGGCKSRRGGQGAGGQRRADHAVPGQGKAGGNNMGAGVQAGAAGKARAASRTPGAGFNVTRTQAKAWAGGLGVSESPSMYSARNLYQLLDGGADAYVQKGVLRVAFVELGKGDAPACRVTVFLLKDEASAKGLLETEKDPGWKHYEVGDGAFGDKEGLVFRKGRILGRVERAGPRQACPFLDVAKRIAADKALDPGAAGTDKGPGRAGPLEIRRGK